MSAAADENPNSSVPSIVEPSMSGGLQDERRQQSKGLAQGTREQHGLFTPEPDDRRNDAETVRHKEANGTSNESESELVSDSESEVFEGGDPTTEQVTAVVEVKNCRSSEHHKILGAKDTHETREEAREDIMNAFRKRGALTHDRFNKHKDAKKVFAKVLKAARALLDEEDRDYINEMKYWDGKEIFDEIELVDGNWVAKSDNTMQEDSDPLPEPTDFQKEIHKEATQHFKRLMNNPNDNHAKLQLKILDERIVQHNREHNFTGTSLRNCTIPYNTFIANFQMAAPYTSRLKNNALDMEARKKFDDINNILKIHTAKYHLPPDWCMADPVHTEDEENTRPQRAKDKGQFRKGTKSNSSLNKESRSSLSSFRKTTREPGYVQDKGIKKQIVGCVKVGFGHQFLLKQPGNQGYSLYELVRASTFGRGAANSYNALPTAEQFVLGGKNDLEGKDINNIAIGGVASVRRDMKKELKRGWKKDPNTYVLAIFGDNHEEAKWYSRSSLGVEFGQALIDEEIESYRRDAGQKPPKGRPRLEDSDDEDEGSISLGEEGTEDDNIDSENEDEDEDENEDDEDEVQNDNDDDEDEETARLERELNEKKKLKGKKAIPRHSQESNSKSLRKPTTKKTKSTSKKTKQSNNN